MKLNVKEIFYSLQGEGGRAGEASIFIRLTKCNLKCSFCDTDFAEGEDMFLDKILKTIQVYPCKWIIWTGGEPTLQLKDEHLDFFKSKGYKQAIETNGTKPVSSLIDYITCSPKNNYERIKQYLPSVDEIRIPLMSGDILPPIEVLPVAHKYFISPVFDGSNMNQQNIDYCVKLVKEDPRWILSLQTHKLIHIE